MQEPDEVTLLTEVGSTSLLAEGAAFELSDDELVESILTLRQSEKEMTNLRRSAEMQLVKRYEDRGASKGETQKYLVKIDPVVKYEYNEPLLRELKQHCPSDLYDQAVTFAVKVNKTKLNNIAKYGGVAADLIRRATTPMNLPPKVQIEPIARP